jgi:hypothetical protein
MLSLFPKQEPSEFKGGKNAELEERRRTSTHKLFRKTSFSGGNPLLPLTRIFKIKQPSQEQSELSLVPCPTKV